LRKEDMFSIMHWRNQQIDYLRQAKKLTKADQIRYYESTVMESFSASEPKIILFSFLKSDKLIGYGGLTNLNYLDKRAELSFLLDSKRTQDKASYSKEFEVFIALVKKVCFEDLKFNRLFAETYDLRDYHIKTLSRSGFKLEGKMREHVKIKGKFVDSLIHGILRKDYVKR